MAESEKEATTGRPPESNAVPSWKSTPIQRGHWVRFYDNGRLVIGVVNYVHYRDSYIYALTDAGEVHEDRILEMRG